MTSNIGSQHILDYQLKSAVSGDDSYPQMRDKVLEALREHFRPEFLNRIDETVVFHALTADELKHIVDIQLAYLNRRLTDRKMVLVATEAAEEWLAKTGYDPMYGARPLKRLIQKEIENPLSLHILQGDFMDGDAITVDASMDGHGLTFKKHGTTMKEPEIEHEEEVETASATP